VGIPTVGSVTHLFARPYVAADEAAVLRLINADRLSGQPQTTSAMLGEALAGRSPVDVVPDVFASADDGACLLRSGKPAFDGSDR
jgi:hypothetical protein